MHDFGKVLLAAVLLSVPVAPAAEPLRLTENTVWSGEMVVSVPVTVENTATLTILPGSRIRFLPPIGEQRGGSLLVEGHLTALGTAEQPIIFASAAAVPSAVDWPGLRLVTGQDRRAHLRHCRIKHAEVAVFAARSTVHQEQVEMEGNQTAFRGEPGLLGHLSGCVIVGNQAGIELAKGVDIHIEYCRIEENGGHGIASGFGAARG